MRKIVDIKNILIRYLVHGMISYSSQVILNMFCFKKQWRPIRWFFYKNICLTTICRH